MVEDNVNEIVQSVLAEISHELKNPLNALGMNVSMLKRKLEREDYSLAEEVAAIQRQVGRLNELLKSYSSHTPPEIETTDVDVVEFLSSTVEQFSAVSGTLVELGISNTIGSATIGRKATQVAIDSLLNWLATRPSDDNPIQMNAERTEKLRVSMSRKGVKFSMDDLRYSPESQHSLLPVLARSLIKRQRGRIHIEESDNESTLTIELPLDVSVTPIRTID